jgi:hypothetical protein
MHKNKISKNGKFSVPAQRRFFVHIHHAFHHVLTIKKPRSNTTFSKTPFKNPSKRGKKAPDLSGAFFF